jgi:hypothetical protein
MDLHSTQTHLFSLSRSRSLDCLVGYPCPCILFYARAARLDGGAMAHAAAINAAQKEDEDVDDDEDDDDS